MKKIYTEQLKKNVIESEDHISPKSKELLLSICDLDEITAKKIIKGFIREYNENLNKARLLTLRECESDININALSFLSNFIPPFSIIDENPTSEDYDIKAIIDSFNQNNDLQMSYDAIPIIKSLCSHYREAHLNFGKAHDLNYKETTDVIGNLLACENAH